MLKVTFLEFIMRGIPEDLLFFIAAYAFANIRIQPKKYMMAVILQAAVVYIMRLLPIHNGVDSILNLIMLISIMIVINKFEVIKSIKAGIIIMLIEFICEGLNVFLLQYVLKKDLNILFKDPILKIVYSSPSLILFGIVVITYYFIKRKEMKQISYGETI